MAGARSTTGPDEGDVTEAEAGAAGDAGRGGPVHAPAHGGAAGGSTLGEDDNGTVHHEGTFQRLAAKADRPKLLLKIGVEPHALILAEGQSLRRCVQKGWLFKRSEKTKWLRGWKRRFFRVVVHTTVTLLNEDMAMRGAQQPRMDEVVTAAWLLYYDDEETSDAKETIDLFGRSAGRPTSLPSLPDRFPSAFEVAHERRRTYYLRPCPIDSEPEDSEPLIEEASRWVHTINAAVESINRLFIERFRRAG